MRRCATPTTLAARLQRHGLAVIEGQQGLLAFRKLVQIRPARLPTPSIKPKPRPMRR